MITWPVDFYGFVASNLGENDDSPVHHSMGWHPILRETQRDWYMCLERDNGGSAYRQHNTTRGDVVEAFTIQCPQNRPAQKRGQKKGRDVAVSEKRGMLYHLYTSKIWRIESENDRHWSTIARSVRTTPFLFLLRSDESDDNISHLTADCWKGGCWAKAVDSLVRLRSAKYVKAFEGVKMLQAMLALGPRFKTVKMCPAVWLCCELKRKNNSNSYIRSSSNLRVVAIKGLRDLQMFEDMFRKFDSTFSPLHHCWKLEGASWPMPRSPAVTSYLVHTSRTMGFAPWEQLETPMAGPVPKEMPHPERCPQQPAVKWHKTFPTKDGSNVHDSVESPAEWKKIKPYQATPTSPVHPRVSTEVWDFFSTLEASLRTWTVKAKPMNRTNCIEANQGKSSGIRAKDGCQYCWDHWLKRASRLTQILHLHLSQSIA